MSNELLYLNNIPLLYHSNPCFQEIPGIENYKTVSSYFDANLFIYDRTGTIASPFNIKDTYPLPEFDPAFTLSYKECALNKMQELDKLHLSTGKTFKLLYSGGVDSSGIFAAFVEYYGVDKTNQLLEICCSKESIEENPWLWDRFIRKENFNITSSHNHTHGWFDNKITLMGEGNDQLFGRTDYAKFKNNENLHCKITVEELAAYLDRNRNNSDSQLVAEFLIKVGEAAPFKIDNLANLVWWYNFNITWTGLMYRVLSQVSGDSLPVDVLEAGICQFYSSNNFQLWSMKLHYDFADSFLDMNNYKEQCKNLVIDTLKIPEYKSKGKFTSFPRVHSFRRSASLIDTELNIYRSDNDYLKFANEKNSFANLNTKGN